MGRYYGRWKKIGIENLNHSPNMEGHMKKVILMVLALVLVFSTAALAKVVTTPSGLKYDDTKVGTGAEAKAGKTVFVHYAGWLDENGKKGKKFDSSLDRGKPFSFSLGAGMVIKGRDEGVAGMKVGGTRTLMLPANLGYGARGAGAAIPPNANLLFDVELLDVK